MSCKDCKYFERITGYGHLGECTFNPPATIRRLSEDMFYPSATVRVEDTCSMETPEPEDKP
ncbi:MULTISPECIES: hypothetical protein [unclassified Mesorhizobium]|uniref:hypothetical protein n=1 Tax=unclassified Mesorhizobium TaxID=325217 RepID=UPI000FDBB3F5|nr:MULTISPECIES: hypothetical protein [unclassified Mesorhizobium]TGT76175.1 hypothetical protein EN809_000690 [Mesorhizobium sp. M2E.F.Ca.ET.166.01.1.1]TGW02290.1 hypothetical protein EN797_000690 [Mesorhizobium sp. M2E.F.Ca.ET.154.01.1.1]